MKAENILDIIGKDLTEQEKVKLIIDYLDEILEYDQSRVTTTFIDFLNKKFNFMDNNEIIEKLYPNKEIAK